MHALISCQVNFMLNRSPCLTKARSSSGGHWLTTRGRRMSRAEMLRLFAIKPARLNFNMVSSRKAGGMIGNAIAVNVLERIFCRLLPAAGLVPEGALIDRWATSKQQHEAVQTLHC
jgi:hypothetical protein